MRIVFMGTPEFAVGSLKVLLEKHEVVGVFTQPDKPVGRKQILTPPPVKLAAESAGIPVFQPNSVKTPEALELLKKLEPEIIVVVAYGKILPPEILHLPPLGCVNVHASLLPRHRGASPIQWCLVCGDKKTGVTTMKMDEGMDTGDMLIKSELKILPEETAGELHDRLAVLGAETLIKTLDGLEDGRIRAVPQPEDGVTYAPIIKKEMALIDFKRNADAIVNTVRGFNPWPVAYLYFEGKRVKVYKARVVEAVGRPGEVLKSDTGLIVACKEQAVEFLEVQPEGSKKMPASAMLRGRPIPVGTMLGD